MSMKAALMGVASLLTVVLPAHAEGESSSPSDPLVPTATRSAAEPATAATPAQPPVPPPCADSDAEGPFLSSTGCSGVFGVRGSAVSVRGVSRFPVGERHGPVVRAGGFTRER